MTASAVGVGSRKEEKAKRPSASKEILLRCYMRLRPESQELCVYLRIERLRRGKPTSWNFGIKPFYPKIGGHVFTPKFGRNNVGTRSLPRLCQSRRIDVSRFRYDSGIGSLGMTSADSDDELRLALGNYKSDSAKRERLESKLS